jgi:exonuclease SbcC
MSNYRVSRIYIKNFKLFDKALIDFNESNLVVLDGPNGFGKTSIFDAIELVLTGQISRVSNNNNIIDGRESYKDVLVSKNPNLDTLIMIEFKADEDSFVLAKKISCNSINNGVEKNPNNLYALFKTYKVNEFITENHDFLPENEISQEEIDHLLSEDLKTFYNLYYYIEQEDRIRYLKKPEKDRMKVLSILFNTAPEKSKLNKIKTAKDNVDKIITKVKAAIQEKEIIKDSLKQSLKQQINEVSYETLLEWRQIKKDWDKEELDIKDNAKKTSYIEELNNIKSFIKYYVEYKNEQQNREFEYYADKKQSKLLEHAILLYSFLDSYEEIAKKYNTQETYNGYLKILNTKQLDKFNFEDASKRTNTEINLEDISRKLEQISQYKKSSNEISKLINELNETRAKLVEQFDSAQKGCVKFFV